ncbi:MAG: O-antigen ligase family protein [Chloroflexota bacterium]
MNPLLRLNRVTEGLLAVICGFMLGGVALYINASSASNKIIAVILGALLAGIVVFLVGNLRYLLFGIIFIDLATGIDFFVSCDETFFLSTCGFNISLTTLALVGLYALWVISVRRDRRQQMIESVRHPRLSFAGKMALGFIVAGVLSLLAARNISYALYQLWIYATLMALYFYLANNITSQKELIFLVALFVLGLVIQNFIIELLSLGILNTDMAGGALQRATGTFRSPNVAGGYLAEIFCILLACLALKLPQWQKMVLGAVLLLTAYNLVGTESRGAWLVAAIGVVVIAIVGIAKKWIGTRSLAVALMAVTIFAIFFSGTIINRWTADDNGSADARGPLAQIAFNMIRANPIVGVGSNNFGVVLFDYVEMDQFSAWLHIVHNDWLLVWSETGTIGLIFYVAFWLASIVQAIRLVRSPHPVYAVIATGILASMLGTSMFMMVERYSWRNLLELVWIETALLSAMVRLQKQESEPGAEKPSDQLTLLNFFH